MRILYDEFGFFKFILLKIHYNLKRLKSYLKSIRINACSQHRLFIKCEFPEFSKKTDQVAQVYHQRHFLSTKN